MKRKVIKQGNRTLTLTLPSSWVKNNNILQGQELTIDEKDGSLVISKEKKIFEKTEVMIDIDDLTYFNIVKTLTMLYRTNHSKVKLRYSRTTIYNDKSDRDENIKNAIEKILKRFIGSEIILVNNDYFELELMVFPIDSREESSLLENKIFEEFKIQASELLSMILENSKELSRKTNEIHDLMTKNINYLLRVIHGESKTNSMRFMTRYSFYVLLDMLIDVLRDTAHDIQLTLNTDLMNVDFRKDLIRLLDLFLEEYGFMISNKPVPFNHLIEKKEFKKKISLNYSEHKSSIFSRMIIFLDTLVISSECAFDYE
jgi:antitoxin component of MazEF toxin-antitoxin module